jgi:hypothetical protein
MVRGKKGVEIAWTQVTRGTILAAFRNSLSPKVYTYALWRGTQFKYTRLYKKYTLLSRKSEHDLRQMEKSRKKYIYSLKELGGKTNTYRAVCSLGTFSVSNLMGIKQRIIDTGKRKVLQ